MKLPVILTGIGINYTNFTSVIGLHSHKLKFYFEHFQYFKYATDFFKLKVRQIRDG